MLDIQTSVLENLATVLLKNKKAASPGYKVGAVGRLGCGAALIPVHPPVHNAQSLVLAEVAKKRCTHDGSLCTQKQPRVLERPTEVLSYEQVSS